MMVDIADVVTYTNFGDHRLRGFWVAWGQISPSPIDFHRRPYNTLALPCERVMSLAATVSSRYGRLINADTVLYLKTGKLSGYVFLAKIQLGFWIQRSGLRISLFPTGYLRRNQLSQRTFMMRLHLTMVAATSSVCQLLRLALLATRMQ